jgi:FkbM family methyltransferase
VREYLAGLSRRTSLAGRTLSLLHRAAGRRADKEYRIGRHQVLLPYDHSLGHYQDRWHRYDQALGRIAQEVRRKYRDATVIDVGANVGDTAALVCTYEDVPVLAIEGNSHFLPYLKENARRIGDHVEVFECFVGPSDTAIDSDAIVTRRGTASIVSAVGAGTASAGVKSLSWIVAANPRFGAARLLKIDTDGFDFQILRSSLHYLAEAHPVLFFEYDTGIRAEDESQSLAAIEELMEIGYDRYIVYDNFGNFLMSVDRGATFAELNAFLRSNRRHGVAVYYFDVCCFHRSDRDLFDAVRSIEMLV